MKRNVEFRNSLLVAGIIAIMMVAAFVGCVTTEVKNAGRYKADPAITQGFQSHQYYPEYAYYYAGLIEEPEAIVGIHRDYQVQLNSDWGSAHTSWKELETTAENLKKTGRRH